MYQYERIMYHWRRFLPKDDNVFSYVCEIFWLYISEARTAGRILTIMVSLEMSLEFYAVEFFFNNTRI